MPLSKSEFTAFIRDFDFRHLFNEMGWNNDFSSEPVVADGQTFTLKAVAEKSGFKILHCLPAPDDRIPDYSTRKKIEFITTKLFHEHLIIYTDARKQEQIWQYVVKQPGKPTKITETRYNVSQKPELLFNRASGIFFNMEDEENITIVDVTRKMAENFLQNNEKVTKQFYDRFKKEHTSFLSFIKGIESQGHKDWYASLMLNRLMFCYFIQKKGFLDHNPFYLRDKLTACREKKGKNKFYSFYRNFLLVLFHQGLNEAIHPKELIVEIGHIPYLNGGLFDEHELEKMYEIDVEDQAFEKIFNFFDDYNWYLDDRPVASGKDINPDVIGYIFEKYINDRADMGAYYTKEDITDYISKNCIIPFLFDEVKRNYPRPFSPKGEIWQMVKNSGDDYIYDAIKYKIDAENLWADLPEDVQTGFNPELEQTLVSEVTAKEETHLWQIRQSWNRQAPPETALSTEIWREVIDRRKRYVEIRSKIENGEICEISDFITFNLNIRQFVQDVIESTDDAHFIWHFYKALSQVTIVDPTCGSGAFLFAAMNILKELYESCILRMENFVAEAPKGHFIDFEKTLSIIHSPRHPNPQYFIYKSIILNNLYGVDIMKEAVEIAKLRLFLKLMATVDHDYRKPNLGLEPLPDIDFNVRAGNTLVGFSTWQEILDFTKGAYRKNLVEIEDGLDKCKLAYKAFQKAGIENDNSIKCTKDLLKSELKKVNDSLNIFLAKVYRINPEKNSDFIKWLETHLPFHWFAEFYEIIHDKGGFDIVIGNPPYLEVRQIDYEPKGLVTFQSGAVHNMCIERSLQIIKSNGNISMIVPLALVCTQRMVTIQNILEKNRKIWYSNFAWRPGKLFENVNRALTIFVSNAAEKPFVFNTNYIKWSSDTRKDLFPNIHFTNWNEKRTSFWVPKLGNKLEASILNKTVKRDTTFSQLMTNNSSFKVFYRTTGGLYWKIFTDFSPKFFLKGKEGKSSRETYFAVKEKNQEIISVALLSSNQFWWWYTITSNLRDLNPIDIQGFKFPRTILKDNNLLKLGKKYLLDLNINSEMLTRIQKQTGETQTQSFKIALSKHIINEIDTVLAEHYGFTEEELDFIINYDIKYRMGKELEEDEG